MPEVKTKGGVGMNGEAASEWLKNAGETIGQMRNTYLAILIFALTVVLTLLTQHWQILERETKYQQIHTTRSHSWNKLGLLYAEFPSDYTETEVAPLYRVAVRSVIWTTFLGGSVDKNGENKKFEAALESMSQAVQRLRDYNSDLRAVDGARRLMMPFDHLDAATLASVVHVSSFQVDDKFCEGLGSIEGMAYAAWKSYAQKKSL
jgi:hypothetical protein